MPVPSQSKPVSTPLPRSSKALIGLFALLSIANVAGNFTKGNLETYTKPLLMPMLLLAMFAAAGASLRGPVGRWLIAGLVFAWLGDLALMGEGDLWFGLGMVGFLAMQFTYIVAIWRTGRPGLVRAWPLAAVPYIAVWLAMNIWILPAAGIFALPVFIYSTALVLMGLVALNAVLAMKTWLIAIGGGLFIVSDGVLAAGAFHRIDTSSTTGAIVMATYCAAQFLIAFSLTRYIRNADEPR